MLFQQVQKSVACSADGFVHKLQFNIFLFSFSTLIYIEIFNNFNIYTGTYTKTTNPLRKRNRHKINIFFQRNPFHLKRRLFKKEFQTLFVQIRIGKQKKKQFRA